MASAGRPIQWDYYFSLGKFMHRFADAEATLKRLLYKTSGMSIEDGRKEYASKRGAEAILKEIKALYKEAGRDMPPRFSEALAQFKTVANTRNALLHNEGDWSQAGVEIDTFFSSLHGKENTYEVEIAHLEALWHDTWKCLEMFTRAMDGDPTYPDEPVTWQYKAPPQDQSGSAIRSMHIGQVL